MLLLTVESNRRRVSGRRTKEGLVRDVLSAHAKVTGNKAIDLVSERVSKIVKYSDEHSLKYWIKIPQVLERRTREGIRSARVSLKGKAKRDSHRPLLERYDSSSDSGRSDLGLVQGNDSRGHSDTDSSDDSVREEEEERQKEKKNVSPEKKRTQKRLTGQRQE